MAVNPYADTPHVIAGLFDAARDLKASAHEPGCTDTTHTELCRAHREYGNATQWLAEAMASHPGDAPKALARVDETYRQFSAAMEATARREVAAPEIDPVDVERADEMASAVERWKKGGSGSVVCTCDLCERRRADDVSVPQKASVRPDTIDVRRAVALYEARRSAADRRAKSQKRAVDLRTELTRRELARRARRRQRTGGFVAAACSVLTVGYPAFAAGGWAAALLAIYATLAFYVVFVFFPRW